MYTFESLPLDQHLLHLAEGGNTAFTRRLHPGVEGVLGIRIPDLRALARRIARQDAAAYLQAVETDPETEQIPYMEARTLQALVLGYIKPTSVDDYLAHVARWVPRINSWSVCDAFRTRRCAPLVGRAQRSYLAVRPPVARQRPRIHGAFRRRAPHALFHRVRSRLRRARPPLRRPPRGILCAHGRGLGGGRVLHSFPRAHPAHFRTAPPAPVDAQQSLAENSRVASPR